MLKEIVTTNDGTLTLYSKEFDECYHSTKDGALNESLNKHIIPAFKLQNKKCLVILDICFGLGYNTLSTIYYYKRYRKGAKVHIISPEFDKGLVESLKNFSYPKEFDELKDIIYKISNDFYYEDENFKIDILLGDAREEVKKIEKKIDIIYQDAFSPKKNPLLWTKEWFRDLKRVSNKDVILTTYSVATPIRLALYENGFNIYKLQSATTRGGTIASLSKLNLEEVDMELKKKRNPNARALSDDYIASSN